MKKRLRKKLRVKEFQELGFQVDFKYINFFDKDVMDAFTDVFLSECILENCLLCGGCCKNDGWNHFFVYCAKGSVSDAQRDAVKSWLESNDQVSDVTLGDYVDVRSYGSMSPLGGVLFVRL